MSNVIKLVLLVLAFSLPAYARDIRVSIRPDGSVSEIPPKFGPVSVRIVDLGQEDPKFQITIGEHQTSLPNCVMRMIRTANQSDIKVTASWDHERSLLPPYISFRFFDAGDDPKRDYRSSYDFLFDLQNAKLIQIQRFEAFAAGDGGQYKDATLSTDCSAQMGEVWSRDAIKPTGVDERFLKL